MLGSLKGSQVWAQHDTAMLLGWSVTKSVLNALVGIRVRQGKMRLEQSALLPEWCAQPQDERCNITVLQLLQMSSGLHFDETYGAFGGATHMLFANTDVAKFAIQHQYDDGTRTLSKPSRTAAPLQSLTVRRSRQAILLLFRHHQHLNRCSAQFFR